MQHTTTLTQRVSERHRAQSSTPAQRAIKQRMPRSVRHALLAILFAKQQRLRVRCVHNNRAAGASCLLRLSSRGRPLALAGVTGDEGKVNKIVELMSPFGIVDLTRTGKVALPRV